MARAQKHIGGGMVLGQADNHKEKNKRTSSEKPHNFYTKVNSKWVTDLNVKHSMIKLWKNFLKKSSGTMLEGLLDMRTKRQSIKGNTDKFGLAKVNVFVL